MTTTTANAVTGGSEELACVLVPLDGCQLVLPSVCIAEIMPWRRIKPLADAPDWCMGLLAWRGETVPVVRFEPLNQPQLKAPGAGRCLVVMNRTAPGAMPFYALAGEGMPRLVQLSEADVSDDDQKLGKAETRIVRLGAELASVPDLAYLESRLPELTTARA